MLLLVPFVEDDRVRVCYRIKRDNDPSAPPLGLGEEDVQGSAMKGVVVDRIPGGGAGLWAFTAGAPSGCFQARAPSVESGLRLFDLRRGKSGGRCARDGGRGCE